MNFIDNQPPHLRKMRQPFFLAQEHAETFRRRQQNMRRLERLARPLMWARIAGAQRDANRRFAGAEQFTERHCQVLFQIVTEGAQRRNVDALNGIAQNSAAMWTSRPLGGSYAPIGSSAISIG